MARAWTGLALLFIINPSIGYSLSEPGTKIHAPTTCKNAPTCGGDLTLAEAKRSFAAVSAARSKCHEHSPDTPNSCDALEALTDYNVCDSAEPMGHYYFWAPIELFQNGPSAFSDLTAHARDGQVFGDGYVIIEANESKASERHLALCEVSQISTVSGPPKNCATVAIITPKRTWLRGGNRRQSYCLIEASFRVSGAIKIEFEVLARPEVQPFADALSKMMMSDLGLTTEEHLEKAEDGAVKFALLTSAAALRNSTILSKGWRETLDFDIYLQAGKESVAITGVAHVMVCRQALGSLVDYRGLDDAQRTVYAAALDSGVGKALKAACKNPTQRDARTISCQ